MPTAPAGSSSRHDQTLRSTGCRPFAAYQRWRAIHGPTSSILVGERVASWISAMRCTWHQAEPEEVAGAEGQGDGAVVGDLRKALPTKEVREVRALELVGYADRR